VNECRFVFFIVRYWRVKRNESLIRRNKMSIISTNSARRLGR